jgi:hypothetical protein
MSRWCRAWRLILLAVAIAVSGGLSAEDAGQCDRLVPRLASQIIEAICSESFDLTTDNPATTRQNNSLPGLPAFAFTPQTDREVISPNPPNRTPITKAVPGIQLDGRIAGDTTGQGRILLRLPNVWNGKLVVAGASGTRSEFNGDFAWSDYVLQQGYAYVSQNKGVLNFRLTTAADPLGCRLNPSSPILVHFYDNDPDQPFTRWTEFMIAATRIGKNAVSAYYGRSPRRTYAVGTSNGGYQVRRALEAAPDLYDGGVDWEGTYVDPVAPNLLSTLPPAILNFPDYVSSGFDQISTAAKNIITAGYPPDIVVGSNSLWGRYSAEFWEVTFCQWQKRLDPTYDTYGSGTGTYSYVARLSASDVGDDVAAIATTGNIGKPLITVAGTMDALLPINLHARAYARAVSSFSGKGEDGDHHRPKHPAYRLYEVQNGNHIETYKVGPPPLPAFPQLELIQPHAQRAFDLLVDFVERGADLPPDQCIPRGGSIASSPAESGHCAALFVP